MNDQAFHERVTFVRAEAKRIGRDPDAIKISNVVLMFMVVDTSAAARQTIEGIAAAFNLRPESLIASPVAMIGTPEQCVAELRQRAKNWGVTQFVFSSSWVPTKSRFAACETRSFHKPDMSSGRALLIGTIETIAAGIIMGVLVPLLPAGLIDAVLVALAFTSGLGAGRRRARGEWSSSRLVRFAISWAIVGRLLMSLGIIASGLRGAQAGSTGAVGVVLILAAYLSGMMVGGRPVRRPRPNVLSTWARASE